MLSYFATYFLHQTSSNHEYMWKKNLIHLDSVQLSHTNLSHLCDFSHAPGPSLWNLSARPSPWRKQDISHRKKQSPPIWHSSDIILFKDFCTYMTLKSLNSSMISMWVLKKCEILGEGLWYQEPDSCQTLCLCSPHHVTCVPRSCESRECRFWGPDARFGVALSISAETWSGSRPSMSRCATWHVFAFLVGRTQKLAQKNQKFPPRFFLNWNKRLSKD